MTGILRPRRLRRTGVTVALVGTFALAATACSSSSPTTPAAAGSTSNTPAASSPVAGAVSSAAQSSAPPAGDPNAKISALTWGDAKYLNGQFKIYQQDFPADAQQQSIDVAVGGPNDTDAVNKFRLELSAHQGVPDIVELNYSEVAEFAQAGELADIQPYVAPYLSAMTSSAKTLMQYNDKYVAVPYEVKEKLWFYRKDMFAQAGIDPTQVKTQADFIAAGKKLQAKFPKSYIWNLASNPQTYILGEITSGNGAKISDPSSGQFVVGTDPGMNAAFTALADLRKSGVVDTAFDDFSPQWQSGLADGTVASVPIASWFDTFLPQYAPKLAGQWGVTAWPEIGGAVGGSEAGGSVFVVPAAAKNKAAALKFLADTFMTQQGSIDVAKQFGEIPNVTAAQSDPAVTNNPYFGSDLIKAYQAAAPDYKVFPYDPAALKEITTLQNALSTFLSSGSDDPKSALQTAQQQLTAQVGNPYKQ